MKEVIGIRFNPNGKVYFFDPGDYELALRTKVVVQTMQGMDIGEVVLEKREVEDSAIINGLSPVVRIATERDIEIQTENEEKAQKAFKICQEKIVENNLEMKLIQAKVTFDNSKILFFFTAENRVDFRALVKDLAGALRSRIELRQVGVRDEAKLKGGIGICGRELCCHSYITEFHPVTIRMVKEQGLSISSSKLSGACGKLMCCLANEEEAYTFLNSKLPKPGDKVKDKEERIGIVSFVNILRQTVRYIVTGDDDSREVAESSADDLIIVEKRKRNQDSYNKSNKNDTEKFVEKDIHSNLSEAGCANIEKNKNASARNVSKQQANRNSESNKNENVSGSYKKEENNTKDNSDNFRFETCKEINDKKYESNFDAAKDDVRRENYFTENKSNENIPDIQRQNRNNRNGYKNNYRSGNKSGNRNGNRNEHINENVNHGENTKHSESTSQIEIENRSENKTDSRDRRVLRNDNRDRNEYRGGNRNRSENENRDENGSGSERENRGRSSFRSESENRGRSGFRSENENRGKNSFRSENENRDRNGYRGGSRSENRNKSGYRSGKANYGHGGYDRQSFNQEIDSSRNDSKS